MATVQSYTKAGVDAKFNSRSNMTMVHNGGGTPDLSAYPDSKTGDVIERASDGARWSVVASTINPIAGRVLSVAGRAGHVTLSPGDVGAAPSSHKHTKAHITDLNASAAAIANSIAQRDTFGRLVVETPNSATHATTKAYVDTAVTDSKAWSAITGKPSSFTPSSHTHTMAQITDLNVSRLATMNTIAQRGTNGVLLVGNPTVGSHAATKTYVDTEITYGIKWSNLSGKPAVVSNVSGSTTDSGSHLSLSPTGRLTTVDPAAGADVANKKYVDSEISAKTTWDNTSGKPSTFPPSAHTHTKAQITDLNVSTSATAHSVAQRDSVGRLVVGTPNTTTHATTKAYVDNAVTAAKVWSAIVGKPSTFTPSTHTHLMSQISDLPSVRSAVFADSIVQRDSGGQIIAQLNPTDTNHAASKYYVDGILTSTLLGTANLNDVVNPGNYFQNASASSTIANNYPVANKAGHLVVMRYTNYVKQEYTDMYAHTLHYRTKYGTTWSSWMSIEQSEV